ncbi:MAG: hypothetical protein KDD60_08825, partial [Bdellovibrionales bacterium]|nr:hypothetical protein [Bdellovibrionales bacterium]
AHPGKEVERVLARENPQSRKREIIRPIVIKKEVAEAPLFSNKGLESTATGGQCRVLSSVSDRNSSRNFLDI